MEDIDIYNPFSDSGFRLKRGKLNSLKIDEKSKKQEMSNRITLTSDTVFGRRQKVSLKLTAGTDNKGLSGINDFSVSIAPGKFIEGSQDLERWMLTRQEKWKEIFSKTVIKPRYSFENNGHILSVTIKYREKAVDSSDLYICQSGVRSPCLITQRETVQAGIILFCLQTPDCVI